MVKKKVTKKTKKSKQARAPVPAVHVFGRKKTTTAVAYCKWGKGLTKVNGCPLDLVQTETLRYKLQDLALGKSRFAGVDVRIRIKGRVKEGGKVARIYSTSTSLIFGGLLSNIRR